MLSCPSDCALGKCQKSFHKLKQVTIEVPSDFVTVLSSVSSGINSKTSVIDTPRIEHTLYVDGINGSDSNDGLSEDTALKTLQVQAPAYLNRIVK